MLNNVLANFYESNLRKLIKEINLFSNEEDLWITNGSVKISCGNLVLRIIEGTNHLIATTNANTGCIYDDKQDFAGKAVERKMLVTHLETLILVINEKINSLTPDQMDAEFPYEFDNEKRTTGDVLIQLLFHLSYHLGQINYLRRHLNKTLASPFLNGSILMEKLYQN